MTLRLPRVPSRHVASSHALIRRALADSPAGGALVVGGGPCQDIPLFDLLAQLTPVWVIDIDGDALQSLGWIGDTDDALHTEVRDVTGWTAPFLVAVDAVLELCLAPDDAAAAVVALLDDPLPVAAVPDGRWALVVASCVASQLHLAALHGLHTRWRRAFAGDDLHARHDVQAALLRMSRRLQRGFVDWLRRSVAPDGRVALTASVRHAALSPTEDGWTTPGWSHMLATTNLAALVDGWTVHHSDRWTWVVEQRGAAGLVQGKAYRIEGLVLSPPG
ncbi:MAG: hypothetical protein ACI8PZ_003238 [Myxococcota bacterium]